MAANQPIWTVLGQPRDGRLSGLIAWQISQIIVKPAKYLTG